MPLHWHFHGTGCIALTCIEGRLHIYYGQGPEGSCDLVTPPGSTFRFKPDQRVSFNCARRDGKSKSSLQPLIVELDASNDLWRNICSAILDRNLFPSLASIPHWLRALFALLTLLPRWRESLRLSHVPWARSGDVAMGRSDWRWSCSAMGI